MDSNKITWIDVIFFLIDLAIFALGICGIVFGSIDIAHDIVNAKSICFIVFGCIGVLLTGPITIKIF